jgi:hypothetical protein
MLIHLFKEILYKILFYLFVLSNIGFVSLQERYSSDCRTLFNYLPFVFPDVLLQKILHPYVFISESTY